MDVYFKNAFFFKYWELLFEILSLNSIHLNIQKTRKTIWREVIL